MTDMIRMLAAAVAFWLAAAQAQEPAPRQVYLETARVEGDSVVTSLRIDEAGGILAGDVDLLFDADRVELLGVRRGAALAGFFLLHNVVGRDTLKVSFASAQAATGGGVLFDIVTAGSLVPRFALLLVSLNGDQLPVDYDRITAVVEDAAPAATGDDTLSAHPNPFNAQTSLTFVIARPESIRLEIYNTRQQRVRVLAEGAFPAGRHRLHWDGTDDAGRGVASGRYIAHLRTPNGAVSLPLSLVR